MKEASTSPITARNNLALSQRERTTERKTPKPARKPRAKTELDPEMAKLVEEAKQQQAEAKARIGTVKRVNRAVVALMGLDREALEQVRSWIDRQLSTPAQQ